MTIPLNERIESLDVLRGVIIAGMILVNNPGSYKYSFTQLQHAAWHGFRFADVIFPAFIFIVGMAMSFSLTNIYNTHKKSIVIKKIIVRAAILFSLGLLLNSISYLSVYKEHIRIMGILQRIGIVYLLASLIIINLNIKGVIITIIAILAVYNVIFEFIQFPNSLSNTYSAKRNIAAYIDQVILSKNHIYKNGNLDPEGILSTIPTIATCLIGFITGRIIKKELNLTKSKTMGLVILTISLLLGGIIWNVWMPINKKLWTSSFVLFSAGICTLLFTICHIAIDVKHITVLKYLFRPIGINPLFVYLISGVFVKLLLITKIIHKGKNMSMYGFIYLSWFQWLGNYTGSLLFSISIVTFFWLIAYFMMKKSIVIKI